MTNAFYVILNKNEESLKTDPSLTLRMTQEKSQDDK